MPAIWTELVLAHFQRMQARNAAQDFGSVSPAQSAQDSVEMFENSRVPQGSVLGLIFFLLYFNGVFRSVTCADLCSFADDTSLSVSNHSHNDLESIVFLQTGSLLKWLADNDLIHIKQLRWKDTFDANVEFSSSSPSTNVQHLKADITLADFRSHVRLKGFEI
ncbi:hypothetical protein J6590_009552 [Homalodisca vitripennis]|nr:hypothetical protein J6590_009552 [Homalodisca vitripennis]